MAARASMLWLIDSDDPVADLRTGLRNDHLAAEALARTLFADNVLLPIGDTTLDRGVSCADDEVFIGVFGRLAVIAGETLATTAPSALPDAVLHARPAATAYLIHTDSQASLGVFAQWDAATLRRSFAANPVDIYENLGIPFLFERDFWAGEHPLRYADGVPRDPQALPFHPIEFADFASREWLGMRLTRPWDDCAITPDRITVSGFVIRPAGYEPTPDELAGHVASSTTAGPDPEGPSGAPHDGAQSDPDAKPAGRVARFFGFGTR